MLLLSDDLPVLLTGKLTLPGPRSHLEEEVARPPRPGAGRGTGGSLSLICWGLAKNDGRSNARPQAKSSQPPLL